MADGAFVAVRPVVSAPVDPPGDGVTATIEWGTVRITLTVAHLPGILPWPGQPEEVRRAASCR